MYVDDDEDGDDWEGLAIAHPLRGGGRRVISSKWGKIWSWNFGIFISHDKIFLRIFESIFKHDRYNFSVKVLSIYELLSQKKSSIQTYQSMVLQIHTAKDKHK